MSSVVKGFYGILSCLGSLLCAAGLEAQEVAFTHVSVIDGRSAEPRPDRTVVIRGNRIIAEGPAATTAVPDGARIIDGRGKFLIPGLWDMHVHLAMPGGRDVLPLYIANGVTGVRDMAGDWPTLTAWRGEITRGTLIGPRIVASGPYLEGGDQPIPHLLVKTPADAAPAVDSLIKLGVDFIKVHGQLTRESYFAIARAARTRGIPFAGHVSRMVGAADCVRLRAGKHRAYPRDPESVHRGGDGLAGATVPGAGRVRPVHHAKTWRRSSAKLRRNGTRVVPTLVAQLEVARWPKRDLPGDSVQRYLPDSMRTYVAGIFPMVDSVPPDADVVGLQLFDKRVATDRRAAPAGVTVLAGTDAPLRNSPPGFGLHEELLLLVRSRDSHLSKSFERPRWNPRDSWGSRTRWARLRSGRWRISCCSPPTRSRHPQFKPDGLRCRRRGRLFTVRRDAQGRLIDGAFGPDRMSEVGGQDVGETALPIEI